MSIIITIIPLIGSLITVIISIGIYILVNKKKSSFKLNKYFAGFFLFISIGVLAYLIYHVNLYPADESYFFNYFFYYIARISYSLATYCLLFTTFLFLHSEKMNKMYEYFSKMILFFMYMIMLKL